LRAKCRTSSSLGIGSPTRKTFTRQADVFAAYWAYSDHEIGWVVDEIEKMGRLDNPLIIYVAGD
jgi:arylsulfatase